MRPAFSEFSYGFALTRELCARQWGLLQAAPVFPSLFEEGRQGGGGYDLKVLSSGNPLFLQFKISERMIAKHASQWDHFGRPYFRFWITGSRRSRQHELLLRRDRPPNLVLYAASALLDRSEFNRAFFRQRVIDNTAFFRPRDVGSIGDGAAHPICFRRNDDVGYLFSEPRLVPKWSDAPAVFRDLERRLAETPPLEPSDDVFEQIAGELEEIFERGGGDLRFQGARARAAYLTRTLLGAELLWLSREQDAAREVNVGRPIP